jgi:hypothetical protein
MINLKVTVDTDVIDAYRDLAKRLPSVSRKAFKGEIIRLTKPMLAELKPDPGPVVYADNGRLRWKSERQRRAFFATNGFGGGIPHQRTGALQAAWEVEIVGKDFSMDVFVNNDSPGAIYVQGDYQQPFHMDTGFPAAAPIFVRYEEQIGDALINTWFSLAEFVEK